MHQNKNFAAFEPTPKLITITGTNNHVAALISIVEVVPNAPNKTALNKRSTRTVGKTALGTVETVAMGTVL